MRKLRIWRSTAPISGSLSLLIDLTPRNRTKDPNGIRLTIRLTRQDMDNYEGVGQAVT